MRSIQLVLGILFILGLNSCNQDLKKLDNSKTDNKKIQLAEDFATNFLSKYKNGSYQFKDEAIATIKNSLTEEFQKTTYKQLKNLFGEFQSLEYAESWIQSSMPSVHIIRFKSNFDKSSKKVEVRVVINEANKIAGFWVKSWSDILK